jgi:hypothetical protein
MTTIQNTLAMNEANTPNLIIPEPIERMREGLLACCGDIDGRILRQMLGANDGTTLETALDHWLLRHLDLDDERIAQGLFQVLFQQFFRELEETRQ